MDQRTMAKCPGNSDRQPAAHKIMKTKIDEDERLSSLHTTAELWMKLEHYVLREIFAYMDIPVSNRCCRVNKLWRSQLVQTKVFNKSIAFSDWSVFSVGKRTQDMLNVCFGQNAPGPRLLAFQLDLSGITHLVCIGSTTKAARWGRMGKVFAKITLWGSRFTDLDILRTAAALQVKGTLLQVMQCDVRWAGYSVFPQYGLVDPSDQLYRSLKMKDIPCVVSFPVQYLVFDGTFKEAKGQDKQLQWLYEQFDRSNLIWPYEEDQVEWLRRSLKLLLSLEKGVLDDVQRCEHRFYEWSRNLVGNLKTLKVKYESSSVNRAGTELNTLDCAFLGRLISNLPEGKRPEGWMPPPHSFIADFVRY